MVSKKKIYKIAAGILTFVMAITLIPLSAAFGESGFRPGNIISDANMYQSSPSMTQAEIQKFLQIQGANCKGNGCLKNLRFDTRSYAADKYCQSYQGAKNEPVSQIIYKVAKSCKINPKVLLVTIQKEQSGVTKSLTKPTQNKLLGYGCPDNRPCNELYNGVQNQLYRAARQFQIYRAHPKSYDFYSGKNARIQFSPDQNCGSSKVKIENAATASLYNYTPYQPNQAILSGNPDSCSAYGNYNFFTIYKRWFGDPRGSAPATSPKNKVDVPAGGNTGTSSNTKAQAEAEQKNKPTKPNPAPSGKNQKPAQNASSSNSKTSTGATNSTPAKNSKDSTTTKPTANTGSATSSPKEAPKPASSPAVSTAKADSQKEAAPGTANSTNGKNAATPAKTPSSSGASPTSNPKDKAQSHSPANTATARSVKPSAKPVTSHRAETISQPKRNGQTGKNALASTGSVGVVSLVIAAAMLASGVAIRRHVVNNRPIRVNC